jgi:DNA-binding transcriptional LysR family regulator
MDSRELAYFVAVAEELNFSRAAERLGIAQPPLSRAVRQLERRLGVTLLTRTSREVRLTPAGEALLDDGRRALRALDAAATRARRAGHPTPRLVCATKPGGDAGLLEPILARYATHSDAIEVEVLICGLGEQAALLRDGTADVAMLHLPYDDTTGLDTEQLLVEEQIAVLPRTHRLAGHPTLRLADLAGETLPRFSPDDPPGGPLVRESAQLAQLIALGRTIAVLPASARPQMPDTLVTVPVLDAAPTTLLLAWPEHTRSTALAAFVRTALEVAGRATAPA